MNCFFDVVCNQAAGAQTGSREVLEVLFRVSKRGPNGVFGRCSGNNGVNEVWPETSLLDQQNVCSTKCGESSFYHKKTGQPGATPPAVKGTIALTPTSGRTP